MTWRFWTKSKVGIPCELHAKKRIGQYNDLQKKVIHDNDLQISDIVQHILKKVFCYNISFIIKSDSILQSHWQKAQKQSLPWSVTVIRFAWPSTWLARAWCLQLSEYFSFQISEYFVAKLSLSESWKRGFKDLLCVTLCLVQRKWKFANIFSTADPLVVVTVCLSDLHQLPCPFYFPTPDDPSIPNTNSIVCSSYIV